MIAKRLALMLVFISAFGYSFAGNWLVLQMKSGSRQCFQIPGKMTVRAEGESLNLSSDKLQAVYFPLRLVESYSFFDDTTMGLGIDEVVSEGIRITYLDKNRVELEGLAADVMVRIFGINGVEYPVSTTTDGLTTTISLSNLPKGVYIINIANLASVKVNH